MALPTFVDLKSYLRIETNVEDVLVSGLLASASAAVRAALRRPIEAASTTYTIEDPRASSHSIARLSVDPWQGLKTLRLPDAPVGTDLVLIDRDGNTVDPTTYRVAQATGIVTAAIGSSFGLFPYTATVTVGLATRSDYATSVEPIISQAILDIGADLYFRRNSAATIEREGGTSTSYGRMEEGVPIRVAQLLAPLVRPVL